jgi:hypothetical protein
MSTVTAPTTDRCVQCGRPAKWLWPGNNYEPPRLLCGYHKRAFVHVIRWSK